MILFLALVLLQSSASFAQQKGFKIPLIRSPTSQSVSSFQSGDGITVMNQNDFAYTVKVSIGEEVFHLTLDTGSSDLWVISNACQTSDCLNVARYSRAFSTNLTISQIPFHIDYVTGSVSGLVASETVCLGLFQMFSQVFGLANSTQDIDFSGNANSGILGLAFPSEASMPGMTVLQSIFSGVSDSYFTISLGSRLDSNSLSSFTVGQIESSQANSTSDFFAIPVSKAGANNYDYWKIPLLYLTINSTRLPLSSSSVKGVDQASQIAVLDTGTTLILGPTRDVLMFWDILGPAARRNQMSGMWQVRCDKAVVVGFVLGQENSYGEFLLDPADISWEEGGSSDGWCLGGIQANDKVDSGDWLLGDVFLRNVYSLYHAANSSSGPWIGLISTMNQTAALATFRQNRGPDLDSSLGLQIHAGFVSPSNRPSMMYTVSALCGFFGGAVLTITFLGVSRHGLRIRKRKE
ncbi:aspartic peptidase domain-containing protein [Rhodocollybia butyracea]|uniref:Aspartic peptidase domain-containing protein n=1 Tax=Rhodocollybia butyracea TaxID=206335 RepID=A0A9P5Q1F8_9AGAR|nr:aspartic peptidase domain-containing protein [Rhodocollybia butyracea]